MTNAEKIRKSKNIDLAAMLIHQGYHQFDTVQVGDEVGLRVYEVYISPAGEFDDYDKALKITNSWLYKDAREEL